eukprot:g42.t1
MKRVVARLKLHIVAFAKYIMRLLLLLLFCSLEIFVSAPVHPEAQFGHLFASGSSALSWDSDELARIRFLHVRSFNDREQFLKSTDLASYLGLTPVSGLHLPVPVNVITIGFKQDGYREISIKPEELQAWFETVDHILPHVRVPLSELSCKEDGHCVDFSTSQKRHSLHSYVHYNISIHAIELESKLTRSFSQLLSAFSRPLFPGHADSRRQIDVHGLETAIDGMLSELGLLWSYNILLINPGRASDEGYVYRAGLSDMEIQNLQKDPHLLNKLSRESTQFLHRLPRLPNEDFLVKNWQPARPGEKFDIQRLLYESEQWSEKLKPWLIHRTRLLEHIQSDLVPYKDLLLHRGVHMDYTFSHLLDSIRRNLDRSKINAFGNLRVMEPEEGCPLDAWSGHHRWVMMDFAASPQDWGPFVGGDGIKTISTIPSTDTYFSPQSTNEDSQLTESILHEKSKKVHDLSTMHIEGDIPMDKLFSMEYALFNRFYEEHCRQSITPPLFCAKIRLAIDQMVNDKEVFTTQEGTDMLRAFLGEEKQDPLSAINHGERLRSLFLAHVSSLISGAIRHVFLPPTLTWRSIEAQYMNYEASSPFTRTVTFRIHILQDHLDGSKQSFDLVSFKKELMGLQLGNQRFQFVVQRERIYDDPSLSVSLASSIKTTKMESIGFDLSFKSEERVFFDSTELQELLKLRFMQDGVNRASRMDFHGTLEVPIFILLLSRSVPIFIDQHSIAKALDNMIIVVQNSEYRGQHPLGITCGGSITGRSLTEPLKAALAATLQHLGGLLPPHLGYSPSHMAITHDWMWSIGANPFSLTSPGWKISQAQKDALHRTYLLDAIDLSVEQVNYGIMLLQSITPSERSFEEIQKESTDLVQLLKTFSKLVDLWRDVMSDLGRLEFQSATEKIHLIETEASEFVILAQEVKNGLQSLECPKSSSAIFGLQWLSEELIGGLIFIIVLVGVYALLPKKRKKKPF